MAQSRKAMPPAILRKIFGPSKALLAGISFFGQLSTASPPVVSLPLASAQPGESVILPLRFETDENVSGVQFDMEWNSEAVNLMAVASDAARVSGKNIFQRDLSPGRKRFLVIGLNKNAVQGQLLADLFANFSDRTEAGSYRLKLSNIVVTDAVGKISYASGSDGEITVTAGNAGTKLKIGGIRNGGSLESGAISPGEALVIFGSGIGPDVDQVSDPGPSSLSIGSTTVLIDGSPAPLLYASTNQINALVPFDVAGKELVQLQVLKDSQSIATVSVPVAPAAPSIFTLTSDGVGPGAILNQDVTVNTVDNPAGRGSIVSLFATGIGQLDPPAQDGQAASNDLQRALLPVSVQVGGVDAEVLYAGSAPSLVSGVVQVNCRIPENLEPGPSVPVVVAAGAAKSQSGVTLSIR